MYPFSGRISSLSLQDSINNITPAVLILPPIAGVQYDYSTIRIRGFGRLSCPKIQLSVSPEKEKIIRQVKNGIWYKAKKNCHSCHKEVPA
jgi:hypothetical protein